MSEAEAYVGIDVSKAELEVAVEEVILHLTQSRGVLNMRHEYKTRSMAEFLAAMHNGGCVLWSSGGFPGGSIQGGGYVAIH